MAEHAFAKLVKLLKEVVQEISNDTHLSTNRSTNLSTKVHTALLSHRLALSVLTIQALSLIAMLYHRAQRV